jgi:hypothetical protein
MKIQIVKKGSVNVKPQGYCAAMVDEAPMNKK